MKVETTKEYNKFKKLVGNRPENPTQVRAMVESFKSGQLVAPIMVNEKMEVIDGQHRLAAARELSLPIHFIVNEGYGVKEAQKVNSTMKKWSLDTHLQCFVDLGYEEYKELHRMTESTKITTGQCIKICMQGAGDHGKYNSATAIFKSGEFKVSDWAKAWDTVKKIEELSEYGDFVFTSSFIKAMVAIRNIEEYDHDRMIEKIAVNREMFVKQLGTKMYRDLLTVIYNKRSRKHDKLDLRRRI